MNHPFRFEKARVTDAAELAALHTLAAEDLTRRLGSGPWSRIRTKKSMRDRIEYALSDEKGRELTVLRSDVIVGTILLSNRRVNFWQNNLWSCPREPALAVFDLAIHPHFQRMGNGRALMRYAERQALDRSLTWVRLDAYASNPISNHFYQALGYEQRGVMPINDTSLMLYEKAL